MTYGIVYMLDALCTSNALTARSSCLPRCENNYHLCVCSPRLFTNSSHTLPSSTMLILISKHS